MFCFVFIFVLGCFVLFFVLFLFVCLFIYFLNVLFFFFEYKIIKISPILSTLADAGKALLIPLGATCKTFLQVSTW